MYSALYLSTLLLLAWVDTALSRTGPWSTWRSQSAPKTLAVMSNKVSGNQVVAMSVDEHGVLSGGNNTSAGGVGGNYVSPVDGQVLVPDALSSQDALVAVGKYLFAVNAGSDSVSMFEMKEGNIELIGTPQSSLGQFPTSLAASLEKSLVCVGNSGGVSGIACATFSEAGLSNFDTLRSLDVGQTQSPPIGPVPGIGDMFFSNDQSYIYVMVKGNGTQFTTYAAEFAVTENHVAATPSVMATPPGSAVLFGTALISGTSNALVSDAGFGGLIIDLNDLSADPIAIVNVTGQLASCWAEISSFTGTGFITDAALDRLVEVDLHTGAIVQEYYPPTPFSGMTDMAISGTYLWVLSAGNGTTAPSVTTFDLSQGRGKVQYSSVYAIPGVDANTQGLVVI